MKVLIACEYSGVVRDAFIRKGHDAMSCDVLPTDVDEPDTQRQARNDEPTHKRPQPANLIKGK